MPTPAESSYKTKLFPLLSVMDSRDYTGTYDDLALNCLTEIVKTDEGTQVTLLKRDGSEEIIASTGTGVVRGLYHWNANYKLFVSIGVDIYVYNALNFALITVLTPGFAAGTSKVGFCNYLYEDGTEVIIVTDGTVLATIEADNTVTTSATVAATVGTHVPSPLYYDGYLVLVKSGTGDAYNSDLNDPLVWTAGNFITAEITPDTITDISRLNNYFILFGQGSIEYFYNAGNPTGTPFARNDVFVKLIGLLEGSIVSYGNQLFIVGRKNESVPEVFMLEDFKLEPISTPAIRRWLLTVGETVNGFLLSMNGHDLYVLQSASRCYYYDIATKLWGRLGFQSDSADFPITHSYIIDGLYGQESIFVTSLNNSVLRFNSEIYQDDEIDFHVIFRTKRMDFGTNQNKFMSSLAILADRSPSVGSIDVEYTDNDFMTYSTPRTIDLAQERPNAQQWGRFRSRAFKFTYTSDNPLRIRTVEISYNKGVH